MKLSFDLNRVNRLNLYEIERDLIPKEKGLYAYYQKNNGVIEYIGSATGQNGLRGRVWGQHLNPKYLEPRTEKFTKIDQKQVEKATIHNGKIVIEKSAFRKNLARKHNLAPGFECLEFLKDNFLISIIPLTNRTKGEIRAMEKYLIKVTSPKYNLKFK